MANRLTVEEIMSEKRVLIVDDGRERIIAKAKSLQNDIKIPIQDPKALTPTEIIELLRKYDPKMQMRIKGRGRLWPVTAMLSISGKLLFLVPRTISWHPKALFKTVGELIAAAEKVDLEKYVMTTMVPGWSGINQIWKVTSRGEHVVLIPNTQKDLEDKPNPLLGENETFIEGITGGG